MKSLLRSNKRFILITLILVILTAITSTITPILVQLMPSEAHGGNLSTFGIALIAMGLSFLLQFLLLIYRENFAAAFNTRYLSSLLRKMHGLSYDAYVKSEPTYLINRIFAAVDHLYLFVANSVEGLARSLLTIVIALVLAFSVHWSIFLGLFILLPINVLGFRFINRKLKSKMEAMQEQGAASNKDLVATFSNADQIKSQPLYETLESLVIPGIEKMYRTLAQTNKFAQGSSSIIDFINRVFQNLLYLSVTYAIARQWLPLSSIVIIGLILPIFFQALSGLTQVNLNLKTLESSQQFVKNELDDPKETDGSIELASIMTIQLDQPTFERDGKKQQYRIKETWSRGQVVYIQGASGSGKSSLLKGILGFRSGEGLRINDIPAAQIHKASLRSRIAYVPQQPPILSRTLEENIGWGTRLTDGQKIELERTRLLAPLFQTKSWHTLLSENGANLSGGEKQRIAIARMLLQKADVILLDESTSSIDPLSAADIFHDLLETATEQIIIYTSHNREMIRYATHILSIETET